MPIAGLQGSHIKESAGLKEVVCPFSGQKVAAVPAVAPDAALIHVQEADIFGNCRIFGALSHDKMASRASKRVIITAERIVDTETFREEPDCTTIPHFIVTAVAEAPRGAAPGSCEPYYGIDSEGVRRYLDALKSEDGVQGYLDSAG